MLINPYESFKPEARPLRTNFHLHAGLEGDIDLEEVILSYKDAQYDVLTISNQYTMTDGQMLESELGITLINGFEYVDNKDILVVGIKSYFDGDQQAVIDECNRQGGFSILAHPNFMEKRWWPQDEMNTLEGYNGVEIFNGVIFRMTGTGLATDVWDELLSDGKLIWGFANDDFHRWYDMTKGWNMIYAKSNAHQDIKNAVRAGNFYASTGLWLKEFKFDGHTLSVRASAKDSYISQFHYRFIGHQGKLLVETEGETGVYTLTGNERYIRVEVLSEHGAMLWTQPVYDSRYF